MTLDTWIQLGIVVGSCMVTISAWSFWMGSKLSQIVTELQALTARHSMDSTTVWHRLDAHGQRLDEHGRVIAQHSEAIDGIRRTCDDRHSHDRR